MYACLTKARVINTIPNAFCFLFVIPRQTHVVQEWPKLLLLFASWLTNYFNHHQLKICFFFFLEAVRIQLPGLFRVISGTTSLFHGCNYLYLGGHPVLIAAALEQVLELEESSEFIPLPPSSLVLFIFPWILESVNFMRKPAEIYIGVAFNILISLGRIAILMILNFLVHEHSIFFHLFRSSVKFSDFQFLNLTYLFWKLSMNISYCDACIINNIYFN